MPTAEQITDPVAEHGEGPVWDAAGSQLLSVDLTAGALVRLDPATGTTARHEVADVLACLRPRAAGGWVLAVERRFALLEVVPSTFGGDDDTGRARLTPTMLPPLWKSGDVRFNDGTCDPAGRFYAGSMAYDETPGAGELWCLEADGSARVVHGGVTISNGMAFTAPDRALYVDSPTAAVQVLTTDPATGDVLDDRVLTRLPHSVLGDDGVPDGLTLDADGGAWVAVHGGGCVVHLDADGVLDARLDVPVPLVTACTFGGPDLATLFVTTSRVGLDDADAGASGAIFAHVPAVGGTAPLPFGD